MRSFVAAAAAVLLLAGCGAGEPGAGVTVTETVTVTAEPEELDLIEGEPADAEEVEAPTGMEMLAFGDRAELDGIMAVTLGEPFPVEMDPTTWNFDPSFDLFLGFPITVENIGAEPVDTAGMMVTVLTGERAAETFLDSDKIQGDPYATVLPGKTVTFTNGYAVGAGEELVVEVQYFMGEDSVFYQG